MTMPAKKDLSCYKGQTYEQNFYFKQRGEPMDLSALTPKSQIRPNENSRTLIAEFICSKDAEAGKVSLSLDAFVTAALNPGIYHWDLKMVDDIGTVKYWVRGKFSVTGRVTV